MKTLITGILLTAGLTFSEVMIANEWLAHDHDHHDEGVQHSGGLDSCGGHTNSRTGEYHYHRGPYC